MSTAVPLILHAADGNFPVAQIRSLSVVKSVAALKAFGGATQRVQQHDQNKSDRKDASRNLGHLSLYAPSMRCQIRTLSGPSAGEWAGAVCIPALSFGNASVRLRTSSTVCSKSAAGVFNMIQRSRRTEVFFT